MSTTYSMVGSAVRGTTNTGLDQLVQALYTDNSLAGNNSAADIAAGASAADALNALIVAAADATGAGADGVFTAAEVVAMNTWIRAHHLAEWTVLHGDDETAEETGYHRVQNDGADQQYRGQNLLNTVIDGIYHMGFEIQNGSFLNEDGAANASVDQVAGWLTQFWTDRASTGSGLDRIPQLIQADAGLAARISQADIADGQDAADDLNQLIADGIAATGAMADRWIDATDVTAINAWIRADAGRYAQFVALHGDDENGEETGYHLVQNDGANTRMFGKNFVDTVADGIYHIGFTIQSGRFLNEDGNANATVGDVAAWINYFYTDQSDTGTGLDRIVDAIKTDAGLARNTSAADINAGANYANAFNHLLLDAISATHALDDGWITGEDIRSMSAWVRADAARYQQFLALHGDDENGEETGYHLVQNDGANTSYFGKNLINTVADGLYHIGFEIQGNNILNEDGNANAALSDMGNWLNYFVKGSVWIDGNDTAETITGGAAGEEIVARGGNDVVDAGDGDDLIWGGRGNDTLLGGAGNDLIDGEAGDDRLDGGQGGDTYRVTGNGSSGFSGYDTLADSGSSGQDRLVALGSADVDVGLKSWVATGVETIDATGATGTVRLLGDWTANLLDFRSTQLVGANIVIDGGNGHDTIFGSAAADLIVGGVGDDRLDGGQGGDTYRVTGNGSSGFSGYDTLADSGSSGQDRLVALGSADVDVGLKSWVATGVETIDTTGASGTVRLLGDGTANLLDFRSTQLVGANIVIDGGNGHDTIFGSAAADLIVGGVGDDRLDGGQGGDTYRVTGNGSSGFSGYDTLADSGSSGQDLLVALGSGDVDVGLKSWVATGVETIDATGASGTVRLLGDGTANLLDFRSTQLVGANIVIDGGYGHDTIHGSSQSDRIVGGVGDDRLDGGLEADTYIVTGTRALGFNGYDTFSDSGLGGLDVIRAQGAGDVDIGIRNWNGTGIEVVDATAAAGTVRLLADGASNLLDFSTTQLIGSNLVIDGDSGHDTIRGSAAADVIVGNIGDDLLDGGNGADIYRVTGNQAGGWASFHGYDSYQDSGSSGSDVLQAVGAGDVDIGVKGWGETGIEAIDGSRAAGTVSLIGDSASNVLDFSRTTFIGSNFVLNGGAGHDTITGTAGADVIVGNIGDDRLDGGNGADIYRVTGNQAGGWSSFHGYDSYQDSGSSGSDVLQAVGAGDVDIGVKGWGETGIEAIDGSRAAGTVSLIGDSASNVLDFSRTAFIGSNFVLNGGAGHDTITGTAGADVIVGNIGDDRLDGGNGADIYRVTGNQAGGWSSFHGYDSYQDSGSSGSDRLVAAGSGDVDIGLTGWSSANGIEVLDLSAVAGTVRILGSGGANLLDFRATTLVDSRAGLWIDGSYGHDSIHGSTGQDTLIGSYGNDLLDGGVGDDLYHFGRGAGSDRITDSDSAAGNLDTLAFAAGVTADQLWFRHVGNDLEVRVVGTSDIVTITDWYSGSAHQIEQFTTADGQTLLNAQVEDLVTAMSGFAMPGWGQTTLPTAYQATLLPLIDGLWV